MFGTDLPQPQPQLQLQPRPQDQSGPVGVRRVHDHGFEVMDRSGSAEPVSGLRSVRVVPHAQQVQRSVTYDAQCSTDDEFEYDRAQDRPSYDRHRDRAAAITGDVRSEDVTVAPVPQQGYLARTWYIVTPVCVRLIRTVLLTITLVSLLYLCVLYSYGFGGRHLTDVRRAQSRRLSDLAHQMLTSLDRFPRGHVTSVGDR